MYGNIKVIIKNKSINIFVVNKKISIFAANNERLMTLTIFKTYITYYHIDMI